MPRTCRRCGEPIADHGPPVSAAGERDLIGRRARTGGRVSPVPLTPRECPVMPVERTREDGSTYTAMVPRRLAEADATTTPPLPDPGPDAA